MSASTPGPETAALVYRLVTDHTPGNLGELPLAHPLVLVSLDEAERARGASEDGADDHPGRGGRTAFERCCTDVAIQIVIVLEGEASDLLFPLPLAIDLGLGPTFALEPDNLGLVIVALGHEERLVAQPDSEQLGEARAGSLGVERGLDGDRRQSGSLIARRRERDGAQSAIAPQPDYLRRVNMLPVPSVANPS